MKHKLIKAEYDKSSGISTVTIRTRNGEFTGKATLHPEDLPIESHFMGCEYAEFRARIKDLKVQKQAINTKIKILSDFEKRLKPRADYNPHSMEACQLRKAIYEAKAEKKNMEARIEMAEQTLQECMIKREKVARDNLLKDKTH